MDILKSKPVIISAVLSVLIVCGAYFGSQWVYRDLPGDNIDPVELTTHAPIRVSQGESNSTDDISSAKVIDDSVSTPDDFVSETITEDETSSPPVVDVNPIEDMIDETDSPVVGVPDHYFNPPSPPSDGINSIFAGATEDNIAERATSYIRTYYPLVGTNPALVSQNEEAKAEYNRQKAALNKEMFDAVRESFSSTSRELLETLSPELLDALKEERLIE